ncbi:serine protease Hayan-like [Battus philenor]|uniref:serine protease Hayan-like n=1 Tax=Battus philenor TaxID=42288 RepID=UPI0035D041B6
MNIFQALQPVVHSYPSFTDTSAFETFTTRRPKPVNSYRTDHNEQRKVSRPPAVITTLESPARDDTRIDKETNSNYETLSSSNRRTNKIPNHRDNNAKSSNTRGNAKSNDREALNPKDGRGSNSRLNYNEAIASDKKKYERLEQDTYETATKRNYRPGKITTENPFYNRPGVKPASVDDRRPPITNSPPTRRPEIRTTEDSPLLFPKDTEDAPVLITAPDEDSMSEVERRRYIEISERMCDRYKNLNTKQVEAIPLLPNPVPVQINITSCEPSTIPLVVGGKVVPIRSFPHMALVGWLKLRSNGYAWRCGGSLISEKFVLTAAHCAYEERDNTIVMGTPRVVQLGSSYLDDPAAKVVKISSVIRHPKFKQPKAYYDIALIKMATAVKFSDVISPACLGVSPPAGAAIVATGWGRTEFGGEQSRELRGVSLKVWDTRECAAALGTSRKLPEGPSTDSQICAGEKDGGKDTCQGDSGGPAQIQDGCLWRVVAVTSLGRSCGAPNTPALYAIVKRAFIASVVFADQVKENEITRRVSEGSTQNSYSGRNNANDGKNTANNGRNSVYNGRNNANNDQNSAGVGRNTANNSRNSANNGRNSANDSRNSANNGRNNNESITTQKSNQATNWSSGRRTTNVDTNPKYQQTYNNYNQQSGDYNNNYDIYNNHPYYNDAPTWF